MRYEKKIQHYIQGLKKNQPTFFTPPPPFFPPTPIFTTPPVLNGHSHNSISWPLYFSLNIDHHNDNVHFLELPNLTSIPKRTTLLSCPSQSSCSLAATSGTTILNLVFGNTPTAPLTSNSSTVLPRPFGYYKKRRKTWWIAVLPWTKSSLVMCNRTWFIIEI